MLNVERLKGASKIDMKIIFIVSLILSFFAGCFDSQLPTDEALEKVFKENRASFKLLLSMANEDSTVMRISPQFTWLTNDASWPRPANKLGFSESRWNEYRELFKQLKLEGGILRYSETGVTYFLASSKGLVTGGSGKGYAYSEKELLPISDSLENVSSELLHSSKNNTVYKKMESNWYLFYDSH